MTSQINCYSCSLSLSLPYGPASFMFSPMTLSTEMMPHSFTFTTFFRTSDQSIHRSVHPLHSESPVNEETIKTSPASPHMDYAYVPNERPSEDFENSRESRGPTGKTKTKRMPRRGIRYPEPNMPHAHTMLEPVTPTMQEHPFALSPPFPWAVYVRVSKTKFFANEREHEKNTKGRTKRSLYWIQPQTDAWRDLLLLLPQTPLLVPHAMPASLPPLDVGFDAADVERSFPVLEMGLRTSLFCAKLKPNGEGEGVFERLLLRIALVAWVWAGRVPIGATPLGADVLA